MIARKWLHNDLLRQVRLIINKALGTSNTKEYFMDKTFG